MFWREVSQIPLAPLNPWLVVSQLFYFILFYIIPKKKEKLDFVFVLSLSLNDDL